jgi:hypothetical protein
MTGNKLETASNYMVHECNINFLTKSERLCYTDKQVKAIEQLALDALMHY